LERATGIEPVLPAWEFEFSILYFQYLQIHSEKMYVHALHTVHALPDLRIAAGRFAGRVFDRNPDRFCCRRDSSRRAPDPNNPQLSKIES